MNGQIFSLNRIAQTSPIRKTELHYQLKQYNHNRRITDLLLAIAVISGLMVPFLRDLGSSYSLATDWEVNRFAFSTSNGRFASLFDLIQQISFSILLLRAISKSRKANWLVISCSVFGLIIYSLMAVVNNAGDLTSVLFGNVPTTVFIIPLFYLLTEDPRIEQLIKEWVPLLSLICFIASLASIIKFKYLCGFGSYIGWCPARDYFAFGISLYWSTVVLKSNDEHAYFITMGIGILACITALMLATRSWLIQTMLVMLVATFMAKGIDKVFKRTVIVIFATGTALLALSLIYPEVLDSFLNRIGEDTRSNQYDIFYSQVEPASLIFGNGISAGYRYGTNSNYPFFDNQIIYLMFHFGVLAVVPLLYVLLRCLFGSSKNSQCKFVALFYLMAILGLSTYYSYTINVGVVLLFSSFGFALNNIEPERSNRMRNADGEK